LTNPDDIPELPDEATTKPGDLWLLGKHRLLCGDSGKAEDVDRLLDGAPIHMVNTDPPYGVRVEPRSNNAIAAGLSSFEGTTHHQKLDVARHPKKSKPTAKKLRAKDRPLANDFLDDDEFIKLLHAWFGNLARVLLAGRAFYIWGGYEFDGASVVPRIGVPSFQEVWPKLPDLPRPVQVKLEELCQAGLSPSINGAPPWYALVQGRILFETLCLNCPVLSDLLPQAQGDAPPAWRNKTPVPPRGAAPEDLPGHHAPQRPGGRRRILRGAHAGGIGQLRAGEALRPQGRLARL
jgi:hypothetical protein